MVIWYDSTAIISIFIILFTNPPPILPISSLFQTRPHGSEFLQNSQSSNTCTQHSKETECLGGDPADTVYMAAGALRNHKFTLQVELSEMEYVKASADRSIIPNIQYVDK